MKRKTAIILGVIILIVGGLFTFLGLTIVNSKGVGKLSLIQMNSIRELIYQTLTSLTATLTSKRKFGFRFIN